MLELITFSALMEGYGILLVYIYPDDQFPKATIQKFENRMVEMFTRKKS
jgi:hypothetical protein